MSEHNGISWTERVNAISINPDMATRDDIARMAAEIPELRERNRHLDETGITLAIQNDVLDIFNVGIKEDIAKLKRQIIPMLDWMVTQIDFQNTNLELYGGDSPELTEAKNLLAELKK